VGKPRNTTPQVTRRDDLHGARANAAPVRGTLDLWVRRWGPLRVPHRDLKACDLRKRSPQGRVVLGGVVLQAKQHLRVVLPRQAKHRNHGA
jgi:hypothetical protein